MRGRRGQWALLAAGLWLLALPAWGQLKADEELVLFPTWGRAAADGAWEIPLHGWVYEPEEGSALRSAALGLFRSWFGSEWTEAEAAHFVARARPFLADNERGKLVRVRAAGREAVLGPSGADGHLEGTLRLPGDLLTVGSTMGGGGIWVAVEAVLAPGDARRFTGSSLLLPETGLSVVSDLDDTIKDSRVTERRELLTNTFLRPFRAVPGMAEVYARWAAEGASFHYVSASPWQLFEPLRRFLDEAGFPAGSLHLKRVRLKDASAANLFASPLESKGPALRALLESFPGRRFVLVGDSGESDPELYGALAREFPDRVVRVLIRDVTAEGPASPRLAEAFRDLPPGLWASFTDPSSLAAAPSPFGAR